ncbi:MAG: polysaccharide biosynthesis/export family protein [Planctomycetota bacterium]
MHLPVEGTMPRELSKVVLPTYTIEPPDILSVDQVHLVPGEDYRLKSQDVVRIMAHRTRLDTLKEGDVVNVEVQGVPLKLSAYRLQPGDALEIHAASVLPNSIVDRFQVEASGEIRLRVPEFEAVQNPAGGVVSEELVGVNDYGSVPVAGKTVAEAEQAIQTHLAERFPRAEVVATLVKFPQPEMVQGTLTVHNRTDGQGNEELVLPLPYGPVPVTNMTVDEAEDAVRERVEQLLYQVTVQLTLVNATPIDGSYLMEMDGGIDLNNPVNFARTGGTNAMTVFNVNTGPPGGAEMVTPAPAAVQQPGAQPQPRLRTEGGPAPGVEKVFYERIHDVVGKRIDVAQEHLEQLIEEWGYFKDVEVSMTLEQAAELQQVQGEHLVCPDGTVTLGTYGSVPVVGLTVVQAKAAIEAHLDRFFEDPEVSVGVLGYNSKVYYVITQGAGLGDGVFRFPVTGNETVLDAIAQINGLEQVSSKRIWIARPTPVPGEVQVLPVSWEAITAQASASTNYQVLPGDRVFIAEDKLVALDIGLSKLLAPAERIMGFTILGVGTVSRFSGNVLENGLRGFGGGGF